MNTFDKVLITGGGGMLAHALSRALRNRGVDPLVLPRSELDIGDADLVRRRIESHGSTLILNCAAYTKVDACEDLTSPAELVNGHHVHNIAMSAAESKTKLVHFSTDFVFDGSATRPYRPDDKTNPLSGYGRSKRLGERTIEELGRQLGLNYLILRTAWLYGPGGPNFVQTMLNAARAGKKLSVVDDQIGSPTFTHDLADATLEMIDHDARGIYHATDSGQTSWFGFARAIFEEFGMSPELSSTTSAEWKASHPNSAPRPAFSVLDCSETEKIIGRKMPEWREALHRYRSAIEAA